MHHGHGRSVALWTLGCKLNQAESEELAALFREQGYTVFDGTADARPADIHVVNTCTVTSKADQKARRLIRKLIKVCRAQLVLVTGCYARLNKHELEAIDNLAPASRRLFVGITKEEIFSLVTQKTAATAAEVGSGVDRSEARTTERGGRHPPLILRSRAFLKIEDGCNNHCSYCRVRLARGTSTSVSAETLSVRLRELERDGVAEAVLTGVNIAHYQDGGRGLAALLNLLLDHTAAIALRLASLEPPVFTGALFDVLRNPRIRPHFHLSVQSASTPVLRAMRRNYTAADVCAIIEKLRALRDKPFIACDIIAGFPGESPARFKETLDFCTAAEFAWIHAFPFSPRKGTEAAGLAARVPEREAVERTAALIELAEEGKRRYIGLWCGKTVTAIAEKAHDAAGRFLATAENYLKLAVSARGAPPITTGTAFRCVITTPYTGAAFKADAEAALVPQACLGGPCVCPLARVKDEQFLTG
ncbi:MAG: tRNA (N(6)-L-threonylcarbamoyladenosine(37)-C(2))-methylthiotransferase MtaB [Spirochaetaceae bacterium]|jgi:threonylcarbamoyladenosine tRNA methylthiotransferase MtaB|nr:tRNA (N(6)-L-threonylcarbamoyladenosine(37)-C(2))-methylthiotransferase MtaB [Spirochaetaceae bacterium]